MNKQGWKSIDSKKWILCNSMPLLKHSKSNYDNKSKLNSHCFFYSDYKLDKIGTPVYTSEGYGVIVSKNTVEQALIIKLNITGQINQIKHNEILYQIPLEIILISKSLSLSLGQIVVPITYNFKEIFKKIETLLSSQNLVQLKSLKILYKGIQLKKTNYNLSQLEIPPFSKLLVISSQGDPFVLERYSLVYSGWGYGNSSDAVCFSTNKDIKFAGFGIYKNERGSPLEIKAQLIKGDSLEGQILAEKEIVLTNQENHEDFRIYKLIFIESIVCYENEKYSCVIYTKNGTSYYGASGRVTMQGQSNVFFNFSRCKGTSNCTCEQSGQFPEIYYYI